MRVARAPPESEPKPARVGTPALRTPHGTHRRSEAVVSAEVLGAGEGLGGRGRFVTGAARHAARGLHAALEPLEPRVPARWLRRGPSPGHAGLYSPLFPPVLTGHASSLPPY